MCTRVPGRECPVALTQLSPQALGEGCILPYLGVSGHSGQSLEARSPNQRPCPLRLGPHQRRIREVRPQVSLGDFSPFPARALWRHGSGSPSKQPWGKISGVPMGGEVIPLASGWAPAPETGPGPRSQTLPGTVLGSSGNQSKEKPAAVPFQDNRLMGMRARGPRAAFLGTWAPPSPAEAEDWVGVSHLGERGQL